LKKKLILLFGLLVLVSSSWYCSQNPLEPSGPGANEVWLEEGGFNPSTLTISLSDNPTVTWTNKTDQSAGIQSGSPMKPLNTFILNNLDFNESDSHTFSQPGTYGYYDIETDFTGQIIVQ
jgi:plastocyanin